MKQGENKRRIKLNNTFKSGLKTERHLLPPQPKMAKNGIYSIADSPSTPGNRLQAKSMHGMVARSRWTSEQKSITKAAQRTKGKFINNLKYSTLKGGKG